jgi:alkylresorcinol/alkylpyrone synthase
MPRIAAVGAAVPPNVISQVQAREFAREFFGRSFPDIDRLLDVFDHAEIDMRHVCMPVEWFSQEKSFLEKNAAYIDWACRLSEQAIRECLMRAQVDIGDVDYLIFVSTTGLATPSIDARLIGRLGMSSHTRRTPIWGLGCAGGAAGLAHAYHHLKGHPAGKTLVVAVELCSLTFHFADRGKSNLIASALFGDGAAAVLVVGDEHDSTGPEMLGTLSTLWPDSLDVMGWNFMNEGMQVVFSRAIPSIVKKLAAENITEFLRPYGLAVKDLSYLIAHPGGAKVIAAYEQALALTNGKMEPARAVLREYGNMSSASVLFVLERFMRNAQPGSGAYGLVTTLGPGFCSENVLLRF